MLRAKGSKCRVALRYAMRAALRGAGGVTPGIFLTLYMQYGGFWCILATRISPEDVVPMVHFLLNKKRVE